MSLPTVKYKIKKENPKSSPGFSIAESTRLELATS